MQVYKFGGASIKSSSAIRDLLEILIANGDNKVIVFSAMGKMTNKFEELFNAYFHNLETSLLYQEIVDFHDKIIEELFLYNKEFSTKNYHSYINDLKNHLSNNQPTDNYDYEYDQIVTYGEFLSTSIIAEFLNSNNIQNNLVDIREIIITDDRFRDAKVKFSATEVNCINTFNFSNTNTYITQGFIGSTKEGKTTSLGREGSDYTAALLAYFMNADSVTVWKDVDGIYNADPNIFDICEKIDKMSFQEAIELAYFGAKILHPKTIKPLQNKNIPLIVRSFQDIQSNGTRICLSTEERLKIPVYIIKEDQILLSVSPKDFSFIAESNLSIIFSVFAKNNVKINLSENSAISFTACVDYDKRKIENIINELREDYKVLFNTEVRLLTIRNYNDSSALELIGQKEILVEQKSRHTARYIYKR